MGLGEDSREKEDMLTTQSYAVSDIQSLLCRSFDHNHHVWRAIYVRAA